MKRGLLAIALFGALSCSDSSGPNILGTLAFTYTGGGGGTFNASGNAPSFAFPPPTATSWAVGIVDDGEIQVVASKPRSGEFVDVAILRFDRTTAGSTSIDADCDIDGSVVCTGMVLFLNFNGDGDLGDFFCGLTTGTLVITEISSTRAKGTFSGTGECVAGGDDPAVTAFSATNGTFDVALVAPPTS